ERVAGQLDADGVGGDPGQIDREDVLVVTPGAVDHGAGGATGLEERAGELFECPVEVAIERAVERAVEGGGEAVTDDHVEVLLLGCGSGDAPSVVAAACGGRC